MSSGKQLYIWIIFNVGLPLIPCVIGLGFSLLEGNIGDFYNGNFSASDMLLLSATTLAITTFDYFMAGYDRDTWTFRIIWAFVAASCLFTFLMYVAVFMHQRYPVEDWIETNLIDMGFTAVTTTILIGGTIQYTIAKDKIEENI